jgi:hypothetical protein
MADTKTALAAGMRKTVGLRVEDITLEMRVPVSLVRRQLGGRVAIRYALRMLRDRVHRFAGNVRDRFARR